MVPESQRVARSGMTAHDGDRVYVSLLGLCDEAANGPAGSRFWSNHPRKQGKNGACASLVSSFGRPRMRRTPPFVPAQSAPGNWRTAKAIDH